MSYLLTVPVYTRWALIQLNTNARGGYLWYLGGSWMTLPDVGYPGVWGLGVGICAGGGGGGGAEDLTVNCNYFKK